MDTTDEWIRTRTGIERASHRRRRSNYRRSSAKSAARRAIEAAGVHAWPEIDFIVFGTTTA